MALVVAVTITIFLWLTERHCEHFVIIISVITLIETL